MILIGILLASIGLILALGLASIVGLSWLISSAVAREKVKRTFKKSLN